MTTLTSNDLYCSNLAKIMLLAVVIIDMRNGRRANVTEYACAVPTCMFVADHQCIDCRVWVCNEHGTVHERHNGPGQVDETVAAAYLEHVVRIAPIPRSGGAAAVHAAASTNLRTADGCRQWLRENRVSERDIESCNGTKGLQALVRSIKGQQRGADSSISRQAHPAATSRREEGEPVKAPLNLPQPINPAHALEPATAVPFHFDVNQMMAMFAGALTQYMAQQPLRQTQPPQVSSADDDNLSEGSPHI
jgi:hypothetical protein